MSRGKKYINRKEDLEKILELVRMGIPKRTAIASCGFNVQAFYNWMRKTEEGKKFKEELEKANAEGEKIITEIFLEKLKETNNLDYFIKWFNIRYNRTLNLKHQVNVESDDKIVFVTPSGLNIPTSDENLEEETDNDILE